MIDPIELVAELTSAWLSNPNTRASGGRTCVLSVNAKRGRTDRRIRERCASAKLRAELPILGAHYCRCVSARSRHSGGTPHIEMTLTLRDDHFNCQWPKVEKLARAAPRCGIVGAYVHVHGRSRSVLPHALKSVSFHRPVSNGCETVVATTPIKIRFPDGVLQEQQATMRCPQIGRVPDCWLLIYLRADADRRTASC